MQPIEIKRPSWVKDEALIEFVLEGISCRGVIKSHSYSFVTFYAIIDVRKNKPINTSTTIPYQAVVNPIVKETQK